MNTNQIGLISESKILTRFLEKGEIVLKPVGDQRYDLVLDRGGDFMRVQCKTGRIKDNGAIEFGTSSLDKSYIGEIDYFAVYVPEINTVFLVPVNDVGEKKGYLRLLLPANKQKKHINYAYKYVY